MTSTYEILSLSFDEFSTSAALNFLIFERIKKVTCAIEIKKVTGPSETRKIPNIFLNLKCLLSIMDNN